LTYTFVGVPVKPLKLILKDGLDSPQFEIPAYDGHQTYRGNILRHEIYQKRSDLCVSDTHRIRDDIGQVE
jgi:hypothetical protein